MVRCKLGRPHDQKAGHQREADYGDNRAQIRLKVRLLLESQIDTLAEKVHISELRRATHWVPKSLIAMGYHII